MDWICDDEDYEKAEMAEDDLQQWAVNPFLPIFNQVESSLGSTTLHTSRLPFPGAKSARKVLKGHTIYSSASLPSGDGLPLLTVVKLDLVMNHTLRISCQIRIGLLKPF